ncbi:hypothetical protein GCM10011348_34200 [Marinobacterium nitratireducens]|uniref:Uncharacterized protein n=1 Tax=Marinobacterium nitratireducens TaxID=518897 RepID=A0A918DWC6_9GAMM|nr:type VI secretion system tube protein Hcp [Marinobacterium nitratireducens]GGO85506.1 hypothetical protein GCM10011348_34200 [Marinobacterium nitratireducens]
MKANAIKKALLPMLLLGAVGLSSTANALQLMSVPGIKGDATIEGYLDWIVIENVQAGVEEGLCSDVTVTKHQDSASLMLIRAASTGETFDKIEIVQLSTGADKAEETLRVTLSPVRISSLSLSSGGGPLSESLSLDSASLIFNDGSPGEVIIPCGRLRK